MTTPPLLELSGIEKQLGGKLVLAGIDLVVKQGEVVCIIGPSGCGKSTLLRCVDFLIEPDAGWIRLEGRPIGFVPGPRGAHRRDSEANLNRVRSRIGFVVQQVNLWPHLTALGNITKGPITVLKTPVAEAEAQAQQLLARVGLADKAGSYPAELSGGEQQRVAIARALAMNPVLMLCDEPTASLDPELVGEVLAVLTELSRAGMTMLVVTHELGFAARAADRIVFMDHGRIVEQGPPQMLLRAPRSDRLKKFLAEILYDDLRRHAVEA
jgi:polar amino acid transport system ATP-binding protein